MIEIAMSLFYYLSRYFHVEYVLEKLGG